MTLQEWRNQNKENIKKAFADLEPNLANLYRQRDGAIERLDAEFFKKSGLKLTDEITVIDYDTIRGNDVGMEVAEYDLLIQYLKEHQVQGFAIWIGEEDIYVYKDNKEIGHQVLSCRGSQFIAEMFLPNGKKFAATDNKPYWFETRR